MLTPLKAYVLPFSTSRLPDRVTSPAGTAAGRDATGVGEIPVVPTLSSPPAQAAATARASGRQSPSRRRTTSRIGVPPGPREASDHSFGSLVRGAFRSRRAG